MSLKVFIVIVVVLGVLFAVGLGLGFTQGGDQTLQLDPELAETLRQSFSRPLAASDLQADASCFQQTFLVVAEGQTCIYTIPSGSDPVRAATLSQVQGTAAEVAVIGEGVLGATIALDPAHSTRLTFRDDGGTLLVTCQDAGNAPFCGFALGE